MAGGGGSKETTTQEIKLPEWMSRGGQQNFQAAQAWNRANPTTPYAGQRVAQPAANQQLAGRMARGGVGTGSDDLGAARAMTSAAASGQPLAVRANATGFDRVRAPTAGAAQQGYANVRGVGQPEAAAQTWASAGPAPMQQAQQAGAAGQVAQRQQHAQGPLDARRQGANGRVNAGQFDEAAAQRYMSPYDAQVRENTLAEIMRAQAMQRESLQDQQQAARSFGGDRHAIQEAEMSRNQGRGIMDYLARANADSYASAQAQFNTDRAADLSAQQFNVGLADQVGARNLSAGMATDQFNASLADQLGARNLDALMTSDRYNAAAGDDMARFNAGQRGAAAGANQAMQGQFRLSDQAAGNSADAANADRQQQVGMAGFDASRQAAMADASAANQALGANADRQQQTGLANQQSLMQSLLANQQAGIDVGRANADRSLGAQQFNSQQQQSMFDRMLAAGAQRAGIGETAQQFTANDLRNLLTTGVIDQQVRQDALDANYNDWLRVQQEPLDRFSQMAGILSGTPHNSSTYGQTVQKQSGSLFNTLMGMGQMGASFFSDRRLKRDIAQVGNLGGLGVYRFRYAGAETEHVGVMADEVAVHAPHALGPTVGGFATVDYDALRGVGA